MDSSCSEAGEGPSRLSLSLISYGSDEEDGDPITVATKHSSDTLVPECHADLTEKTEIRYRPTSSEEDDLLSGLIKQLGVSGVSSDKLGELSLAIEKMEASQQEYLRAKMIFDAATKVAKTPSKLPAQTALKVSQVLDHVSLLDFVTPNLESIDGVFGLSSEHLADHLPNELTVVDSKYLQEAIEEELATKHQQLVLLNKRRTDVLAKVSGPAVNTLGSSVESTTSLELLSLQRDLDNEVAVNVECFEDVDKVLSSLMELKLEAYDSINCNRAELYLNKCKLLKNEIRFLKDEIAVGIYREDKHLVDAYTRLKKHLDLAVAEATSKLSELKKREESYEKLRGTHFDRLVKEYKDLKEQIARKQYALKTLL